MSEPDFESQLAALYCDTPSLPDERAFLASVDAELTRSLQRRRAVLASLGGLGGVVSLAALVRLEGAAGLREFLKSALHALPAFEWGVTTTTLLIVSLLVPVLMRAIIDPK